MYDETQLKIIDATMTLIIEKGYSGATTKNIAALAGVNECTIFRRFREKKKSYWPLLKCLNGIRDLEKRILCIVGN